MSIIDSINLFIWYAVVAVIMAVIAMMVLRLILNYADVNPFNRSVLTLRRYSDPLIDPVRRGLARTGLDPKLAPIVTILVVILVGYFALQLVDVFLSTIRGVLISLQAGAIVPFVGFLLRGLLALYALLIVMRIIFSWGASSVNRVLRFLIKVTEPVLGPFRRLIPPLGMFDISSIVVLLLLQLLQQAVVGTLIQRGF